MSMVSQKVFGERSTAITDNIEDLGVLVSAAHGLDTAWMKAARCASWDGEPEDTEPYPLRIPTPWQFDFEQVVEVRIGKRKVELVGKEMIKVALAHCFGCPVQYACAEYGVNARVRAGTWSMRISDMRWLQNQPDALQIVKSADAMDVPLQRFVPEMRSACATAA